MPTISENALQQAIDAVLAGASLRRASTTHGVPRRTLVRRLEGKLPKRQAQMHHQRLSPWQEENLVDWILIQGALGVPPTHAQICLFVSRILINNGDTQPLGKRWMQGFFARNPQVKTLRGKSIDSRRVNGASAENIKAFFQLLSIPKVQAIKPCNRWNMDETGIMQGHRGNGLVVGKSSRKHILVKSAGSREWVTIIEAVGAEGASLPPLVIFRGKDVQQQWFPDSLEEWESWRFITSPNGWTSNDISQKWLEDIFIPLTARDPPEPRLLVLDGHGSHETDEFMFRCFEEDIYLTYLPAHSSHVLQPLDLSVFSPIKTIYKQQLALLGHIDTDTETTPHNKQRFLSCYNAARKKALESKTVQSGWKATGLWPVNIAKPLMSPLLVSNCNKAPSILPADLQKAACDPSFKWPGSVALVTPQKSADLRNLVQSVGAHLDSNNRTARLLFRKTEKSIDMKNSLITKLQTELQHFRHQSNRITKQRRKKVVPDPNKKFVSIAEVIRTKRTMRAISVDSSESDDSDDTDNMSDCIVVGGR